MNFLNELHIRKSKLKPTRTSVTREDGTKYWEMTNGDVVEDKVSPQDYGFVVDMNPDVQVGVINDYLILGSVDAANDPTVLQTNEVTEILCTAAKVKLRNIPDNIQVHHVPILDIPEYDIKSYFPETFDIISKVQCRGGKILVHCNAGVSRSATVVIAYLMKVDGMSFQDALELVKSRRPSVCPNPGFKQQLQFYEQELQEILNNR